VYTNQQYLDAKTSTDDGKKIPREKLYRISVHQ
jgi:hypothetical protein